MIILDTNVISEWMRPKPNPVVIDWIKRQGATSLCLTAISLAEVRFGLARLPNGRRKRSLLLRFNEMLSDLYEEKVLSFDRAAAEIYGDLMASLQRSGRTVGQSDLMIAAIALANNAAVATRNVRDFAPTGVPVHNPFEPSA